MKKSNAKPRSENHFITEWNGTEFHLSIPAKITHSNKPFIYFYWPNPDNHATIERARKGGIGGVKDSRISIKKKAVAAVDAVILMLGRGWNPFTNAYVDLGVRIELNVTSPISKCLEVWVEHRRVRYNCGMIGKTAWQGKRKLAHKQFYQAGLENYSIGPYFYQDQLHGFYQGNSLLLYLVQAHFEKAAYKSPVDLNYLFDISNRQLFVRNLNGINGNLVPIRLQVSIGNLGRPGIVKSPLHRYLAKLIEKLDQHRPSLDGIHLDLRMPVPERIIVDKNAPLHRNVSVF